MIQIECTLVCSTANLSKEIIDDLAGHWATLFYEEGILVKTTLDAEFEDPILTRILDLARAHGCDWVRFDRDGPLLEGFPSWDW